MALSGFCTVCQRTVYVDAESTPICPVCSSPLLEATESADGEPPAPDGAQESVASAEK
jgi:predicted amidophosphoribosyltransferase